MNVVRAAAASAAGFQTIEAEDQDALIIVAALAELDAEQREALKRRAMALLQEARAGHRMVNHNGVSAPRVARAAAKTARRKSAVGKRSRRGLSPDGG